MLGAVRARGVFVRPLLTLDKALKRWAKFLFDVLGLPAYPGDKLSPWHPAGALEGVEGFVGNLLFPALAVSRPDLDTVIHRPVAFRLARALTLTLGGGLNIIFFRGVTLRNGVMRRYVGVTPITEATLPLCVSCSPLGALGLRSGLVGCQCGLRHGNDLISA